MTEDPMPGHSHAAWVNWLLAQADEAKARGDKLGATRYISRAYEAFDREASRSADPERSEGAA
jgi:hypothetical protein